jgi:hypothetical protein
MTTFAIIESNTGYVWGVVDSHSSLQACYAVDMQAGGWHQEPGQYEQVSTSELRTTRGVYDVRIAPEGFDVQDGQNADEIAAVEALPRAGVYAWVPA